MRSCVHVESFTQILTTFVTDLVGVEAECGERGVVFERFTQISTSFDTSWISLTQRSSKVSAESFRKILNRFALFLAISFFTKQTSGCRSISPTSNAGLG